MINATQPVLNLQSFYDFVKLSLSQQCALLKEKGLFLDLDSEKTTLTRLYFLNGFFVEEITSVESNTITGIIPYKQGYRLGNYPQAKGYAG